MKIVYRAANITEADIVAGMLSSRGIEAKVAGRHLQTAVGAAAVPYSSKVLVSEQQYDEAVAVVAEYEKAQPTAQADKRRSFAALGVFTKPVLFRVSVFLLLVWFLFSGPPAFYTGQRTIILYDVVEEPPYELMEPPLDDMEAPLQQTKP